MRLSPVPFSDFTLGEPLPYAVYDRMGRVLLQKGEVITSADMLERVLRRGMVSATADLHPDLDSELVFQVDSSAAAESIRDRLEDHGLQLQDAMRRMHTSPGPDVRADIERISYNLQDTMRLDENQCLGLLQIETMDELLPRRMIHATAITDVLARALQLTDDLAPRLRCAALSFDSSMFRVHASLFTQSEPLNPNQKQVISEHATKSVELLAACGVHDPCWLNAIAQHHERIDGTGYPLGLKEKQISQEARIIAIADTFTAMIRSRAYRAQRLAKDALRVLFLERGQRVDQQLTELLIKELGIYPPGTLLRLANGDIALSVKRTGAAAQPIVRSVIGWGGVPLAHPLIRDTSVARFGIVEVVSPRNYRSVLGTNAALWAPV